MTHSTYVSGHMSLAYGHIEHAALQLLPLLHSQRASMQSLDNRYTIAVQEQK